MANDAKMIASQVTAEMIFDFLDKSGAEPKVDNQQHIHAITICHGGDSHKLEWSQEFGFRCWTNCGHMDIFQFIQHVFDIDDFSTAVNKVKEIFNISGFIVGGFRQLGNVSVSDNNLNPMNNIKHVTLDDIDLKVFDDSVLNTFYKSYPESWAKEGITKKGANKFNIRMDILNQRAIIPQYDIDNNLIGIRARNFSETALERGFKYTPIKIGNIDYKFQTGMNLYGLNVNKYAIKTYKYAIIFEGEKSVIKMNSWYDEPTAVAMNGSNFTEYHLQLLKSLGVDRVYFAFDKDFHGNYEGREYLKKVKSIVKKAKNILGDVYLIWDSFGRLDYKDSPVDKGKEVFETLKKEAVKLS